MPCPGSCAATSGRATPYVQTTRGPAHCVDLPTSRAKAPPHPHPVPTETCHVISRPSGGHDIGAPAATAPQPIRI